METFTWTPQHWISLPVILNIQLSSCLSGLIQATKQTGVERRKEQTFPVSWSAYLALLHTCKNWPSAIAREVALTADANASVQDSQCGHFVFCMFVYNILEQDIHQKKYTPKGIYLRLVISKEYTFSLSLDIMPCI